MQTIYGGYDFAKCVQMFGMMPKTATLPIDSVQLRNIARFTQLTGELPPAEAFSADGEHITFLWQFICMMASGYLHTPQNPLSTRFVKPVSSV